MGIALKSPQLSAGMGYAAKTPVGCERTAPYDAQLAAALLGFPALLANKGCERPTIRDVPVATRMNLGVTYYCFIGKEQFLLPIQIRVLQSLWENLREIIRTETDSPGCLQRMITPRVSVGHTDDLRICSREIESLDGGSYQMVGGKRKKHLELTTIHGRLERGQ
jgi:hypothetical protein